LDDWPESLVGFFATPLTVTINFRPLLWDFWHLSSASLISSILLRSNNMGNDFDKKPPQGDQEQSGQGQKRNDPNQSSNDSQDPGRKNQNTREFPERKDREGSEDVEKRRAS
jgi:hypothetical protein